jgi:hypothetical protein
MLLFTTLPKQMISARFQFKPEHAADWIHNGSPERNIIELAFEDVDALVSTVKALEDALEGCTALVNGKVVSLRKYSDDACSQEEAL